MNICPTKSVKNKVPQEAWTSMKHNVAHLNFFGCVAYTHVPDELRKKLDNKGHKCVFVGYYEDTKSYKLCDLIARKVKISRDVEFVENEAWDGRIERTVEIIDAIGHDDIEDEVVQTPFIIRCIVPSTYGNATQIPAQTTPVRSTGVQSTSRVQQTPTSSPSSYTSPYPTISSMFPRNTRILCDIYNVDTTNSFSVFPLFSQINASLSFEESFKDDVWAQDMDEEIKCIENNQTCKSIDVAKDKDVISVKWIYKTKKDVDGNVQKYKARLVARGFTQQPVGPQQPP
jgi:hypothetical protein